MSLFLNTPDPASGRVHMIAAKDCPMCKAVGPIYYATAQQCDDFIGRKKYIQDIMPELSVDDRELFQTGTCVPCWDTMMTYAEEG